jgi:hypothetical protein
MTRFIGVLALLACGPSGIGDCRQYVLCSYKTGVTAGSLDSTYGANGSCWQTSSTADKCTADCMSFNAALVSSGAAADAGCIIGP